MTTNRATLLAQLRATTQENMEATNALLQLPATSLNQRPQQGAWSALECLEHLNLYGDYYLPEIEQRMLQAPTTASAQHFKAGWLGNYFVNLIQLKNGAIGKPMKAVKEMTPEPSALGMQVLDRFLKQQQHLLGLLDQAEQCDLTRIKTNISLTKLVKLRLGDTLRFLVYHNQRHVVQAQRAVQATATATESAP